MIERIANFAERVTTHLSVSRRGFLGRIGQVALGVIGVLAFSEKAFADVDCGGGNRCDDGYGCCFDSNGSLDGCCESHLPHTCSSSSECYETLGDAQRACGNDPVIVCGVPVSDLSAEGMLGGRRGKKRRPGSHHP